MCFVHIFIAELVERFFGICATRSRLLLTAAPGRKLPLPNIQAHGTITVVPYKLTKSVIPGCNRAHNRTDCPMMMLNDSTAISRVESGPPSFQNGSQKYEEAATIIL